MSHSTPRARKLVPFVLVALLGSVLSVVPVLHDPDPAAAADDGSLDFTKSGPASILHGEDVTYTLTATNNGTGGDGYNLTFRDVLPAGAVFVSSTGGNPRVFADSPSLGQTTLLFENVADLQSGVTRSIDVTVDLSEATYGVGSSVTNSGGAYMSGDPRLIPDFDASGAHVDNGDTSAFDTDSIATDVEAIRLTKTEPDAEAELLRGVHTEWTTYSLQVDNNLVDPTNALTIEDWIPAGLEFLGCGSIDQTEDSPVTNTTSATLEEYFGSGALGAGVVPVDPTGGAVVATCETPTTVETVTLAADEEFPGQAAGVYTHVVWDLSAIVGTMAASDQLEIMYAAGIPLRENTASFSAGNTNTDHTADLDNNNGPFTTDEQQLTNWSRASATYNPGVDDLATSDEASFTVSAEDLSIHKTVDDSVFVQTETPGWTLLIETGEYRDATGVVVTDTLPDGQCPIPSAGDPETPDFTGECAQTGGLPVPTVDGVTDDPDTITEAADGSWTLVWSTVPDLTINDDYTITFSSRIRTNYQEGFVDDVPVVGADRFTNSVAISGTTAPIADGGTVLDRPTETTLDASSASQGASVVTIDKSISEPTAPGVTLDCDAAVWTTETPPDPDEAALAYRPGDRVCYRVVVDFISDLHFRNPRVTDFIPPNTTFETFWGDIAATGQVLTGPDVVIDDVYDVEAGTGTAPSVTTDEGLEWTLGSTITGGGTDLYVDNNAEHFEVIFSVIINGDPLDVTSADIFDNLAKLTVQNNDNSGGNTFSSRDQAGYPHVEPNLSLDKRNAPSAGVTDDGAETGTQLDVFDYEVDITNDFETLGASDAYATAYDIRIWDILPSELTCADVSTAATLSTAEPVSCLDPGDGGYPLGSQATDGRSVFVATITSLAPQATSTLSYSITLPVTVAAGDVLVNDAGVRDYTGSDDNVGSGGGTVYYPADNIDEGNTGLENAAAADDAAVVNISGVSVSKVQGSGDTDPGGPTNRTNSPESSAQQDATIGETVSYTFGVTIPEGTDLYDAVVTDDLDSELDFVSLDSGSLSLDNGGSSTTLTISAVDDAYFDLDLSGTENVGDVAVDVAGDVVTVTFPANWSNADGSLDDLLSLSFSTIVRDAPGVDIGDNINNVVDVDWDDLDGDAVPTASSTNIRTKVVEPNPTIAKADDGTDTDAPADGLSNVSPGDSVTYTLTVTNPDDGSGHVSAAYDLVVTDVLPEGVTFVPGSGADNPDGGTFAAGTPVGAEGTITWTQTEVAALADLQVGDSIELDYTVTIDDPAVASTRLTNTATVTAESRANETAGERDTYSDSVTDTVELPLAQIVKDVAPFDADPFDGSDTDVSSYAVGEPLDFELTISVPADNQAFDLTAFDVLPAFLEFESYGTPTDISGSCERVGGGALASGDVVSLTPDGQRLGWFLGDVLANGAECQVTLPYTVHVDSVATTVTSGDNSATLVWHQADDVVADPTDVTDLDAEVWDETSGPVVETIGVLEPLIGIDKDVEVLPGPSTCEPSFDADICDTESGFTHRFTVTVFNSGDGDAHDVVVVDTLPAEGAGVPFGITGSPTPTFDAGLPRTLTWDIEGPIAAAGGSVTFTYDVLIGGSAVLEDDQTLVNTAAVTSYWGLSETDRESSPGVLINPDVPEYHVDRNPVTPDAVTLTARFPDLVVVKTPAPGVDDTDARVGDDFRWRLHVYNDGPGAAYDIDVTDTLPSGWLYEAGSATIDVGSGPVALVDPAGGTAGPLVWTDVGQLDSGASFIIEFDTQPQASLLTLGTTGTFDHLNDSAVAGDDFSGESANETGDYGDDNGGPDGPRASDDDSARIRRIDLEIDKSIVESAPHFFGDLVTYRVVVTNDDSTVAVDTASDITVLDVLPSEVLFDSASSANGTYDSLTDTWTLASPLAAGASATLDIVVRINASTPFTNTVEVETAGQWDVDSTPGDHDDGAGPDEDDNDSVLLTPTNADLGNRLWFDVDGDGEQDAGEPGIPGVDVEVSWIDPADGVTVLTLTTTTNSEGEYSFTGLPQDIDLTVTVVAATLPAGLAPTFELVDDPTITDPQASNRETIGAEDGVVVDIELTGTTPSYLDVDFGYTATGSIGDLVWNDLDADGTLNGAELGIDGVDVTVEWGGFDGVIGDDPATTGVDESLDDVTYTTTTAGGGAYLVSNLPPGNYTVSIDPGTLPAGMAPTHDLDGGLDRTTTTTLTGGQNRTDVDFGERLEADLEIEKSSSAEFEIDAEAIWTIAVTNNGPAVADGTITVSDALPDGVVPNRVEGTDWSCSITGQDVDCTYTGAALAVDAVSSFDLVVDVEAAAAPSVTNAATVSTTGGPPDTVPENDTDDDTAVVPLALLGLEKTLLDDLVNGQNATWRIEVTNYGPSATNATYTVTDDLPEGLTFVSAESDEFDCVAVGSVVTCTSTGVLAVGDVATVDLVTGVQGEAGETILNEATVTGGTDVNDTPLPQDLIDEILEEADNPGSPIGSSLGIPSGTTSTGAEPGSILAATGLDLARTLPLAAIFLIAGFILVWAGRRDRPSLA